MSKLLRILHRVKISRTTSQPAKKTLEIFDTFNAYKDMFANLSIPYLMLLSKACATN